MIIGGLSILGIAVSLSRISGSGVQVTPTIGRISVDEAEALLQGGLVGLDLYQLWQGTPGINAGLHRGYVRYEKRDRREHFKSLREIWTDSPAWQLYCLDHHPDLIRFVDWLAHNHRRMSRSMLPSGDCEDLAAAVAAERTANGKPSTLVIYPIRPGLSHAVVLDLQTKEYMDPSKTGGM